MQDLAGDVPAPVAPRRSIEDRVRSSRRTGFLGRAEQRRAFACALRGERGAAQILFVHGIGGIGKSALLRQLADDAHDAGCAVVWIDGEQVGASAAVFEQQAERVRAAGQSALFVDGFDHCRPLETWLRAQFLPSLPEDVLVVVAGRNRPQPHWTLDPGWRGLVREMPLGPLDRAEAAGLLAERGVPGGRRPAVHEFAGGHPLALCLAAAATTGGAALDDAGWVPGPVVVRTLLGQVVEPAPSAAHEYGLRVCCHVRHTTLDLLRTGLDEDTARVVFDWLSGLPCVTPGVSGLLLHDLVREVLDADFTWRGAEEHLRSRLRLWRHLGERARAAPDDDLDPAVSELVHLARRGAGPLREPVGSGEPLVARAYAPQMRESVLDLTCREQGDEQALLVAHWLDRQPEAFRVYCRSDAGEPGPVLAWLRLRVAAADVGAEHLERFVVPAPRAGRAGPPRLSRAEHDAAVRRALRDWHDDDAVAANALGWFCGAGAGVRDVLGAAIDALGGDASRVRHQRVVRATYLDRTTSQEATAAHLDIPFSTFRRHLKAGVDEVCEYLWRHHTDRIP